MNSYDPQKAARVWQRVQENQDQTREENWPAMIQEAMAAGAAYHQLARQLPKYGPQLQRMGKEERSHAAALRGICQLASGQGPQLQALRPPQDRPEILLRKCYARALNRLRDYDRRSQDPEFGPVFRRMGERLREHCQTILEILGEMGK